MLMAGCESAPETRTSAAPADPAALVGNYELWICASGDCGPGASAPGSRIGRLQLAAQRLTEASADSSAAYLGCATIGPVAHVDTTTALNAIRWHPGDSPGRFVFGISSANEVEYEIALEDIGGMWRGTARWRRSGVISEEAPEVVVARRGVGGDKLACTSPVVAASPAAPAPVAPVAKKKASSTRKG